jgi:DMSO/TMAO reductase YedYZ molybdopterin-dependent catalytic subunit
LADSAKPKSEDKFVFFESEDEYTTSLTLEELDKAMLAYKLNGKDIDDELGGPVRLIVPDKYAYKSPMWVRRITFRDKKDLDYWERKGYSDTADPWKNDRYR